MKRSTYDYTINQSESMVRYIANDFFAKEGFRLIDYHGEQVWKKGTGFLTAPSYIKLDYRNGVLHLEAWIRMWGERPLDNGFVGMIPKQAHQKRVAELVRLITQNQPQPQPQYAAAGQTGSEESVPPQGYSQTESPFGAQAAQPSGQSAQPGQQDYYQQNGQTNGQPGYYPPQGAQPGGQPYQPYQPNYYPQQGVQMNGQPYQPGQQGYYPPQPPYAPPVQMYDPSGKAVAALILGIVSFFGLISPVIGVVCGAIGIAMGRTGRGSSKRGMATAGLVLSIIGLVLSVLMWIISFLILMNFAAK